jgi:hypothetical protein
MVVVWRISFFGPWKVSHVLIRSVPWVFWLRIRDDTVNFASMTAEISVNILVDFYRVRDPDVGRSNRCLCQSPFLSTGTPL